MVFFSKKQRKWMEDWEEKKKPGRTWSSLFRKNEKLNLLQRLNWGIVEMTTLFVLIIMEGSNETTWLTVASSLSDRTPFTFPLRLLSNILTNFFTIPQPVLPLSQLLLLPCQPCPSFICLIVWYIFLPCLNFFIRGEIWFVFSTCIKSKLLQGFS